MCGLSFLKFHSLKNPETFPHTRFTWFSLHSLLCRFALALSLGPLSLSGPVSPTLSILCHKTSGLWSSLESPVARQAEGTRQKTPLGSRSQSLLEAQSWERPTRSPGPQKSRSVAPLQSLPERAAQHPVMADSSCALALSRQL